MIQGQCDCYKASDCLLLLLCTNQGTCSQGAAAEQLLFSVAGQMCFLEVLCRWKTTSMFEVRNAVISSQQTASADVLNLLIRLNQQINQTQQAPHQSHQLLLSPVICCLIRLLIVRIFFHQAFRRRRCARAYPRPAAAVLIFSHQPAQSS